MIEGKTVIDESEGKNDTGTVENIGKSVDEIIKEEDVYKPMRQSHCYVYVIEPRTALE